MERELSKPLKELPGFLSTISMVVDDRAKIVESLVQAERKSPPRYDPARAIFCRVLEGDLSLSQATAQARAVVDPVERKCASDILDASKAFLAREAKAHVGPFPPMSTVLPNGLRLSVSPLWLRHLDPPRFMFLHFWQKPLPKPALNEVVGHARLKCMHAKGMSKTLGRSV